MVKTVRYSCLFLSSCFWTERVMVRRKGELSNWAIDTGWPYQVALPAGRCSGPKYPILYRFCDGLSLCQRGHSFRRDGVDFLVY
jgi:hypothetical protein